MYPICCTYLSDASYKSKPRAHLQMPHYLLQLLIQLLPPLPPQLSRHPSRSTPCPPILLLCHRSFAWALIRIGGGSSRWGPVLRFRVLLRSSSFQPALALVDDVIATFQQAGQARHIGWEGVRGWGWPLWAATWRVLGGFRKSGEQGKRVRRIHPSEKQVRSCAEGGGRCAAIVS